MPAEVTDEELDKLFSLSATPYPGPYDDEFYRVARRVVPKIQAEVMRLKRELEGARVAANVPASQRRK